MKHIFMNKNFINFIKFDNFLVLYGSFHIKRRARKKNASRKNYHNKLHTWQHTISISVYTCEATLLIPHLTLFHTAVRDDFYYLTIELI